MPHILHRSPFCRRSSPPPADSISATSFKSRLRGASLVLTLWLVSSCTGNLADAEQQPIETVKVGYLPMVSSLTYFVALEKGYFVDQRLLVQASPIKTSNQIALDLASGHIDAAIELSIVPLLNIAPAAKDPPYRLFSTSIITKENGFDGVVAAKGSALDSLLALSGKKVGVFPGTTAERTFRAVFSAKYPGIPLPIFLQLDPANHINSLLKGEVDALHAYEPVLTLGIVDHGLKPVHSSIYAEQLEPSPIGVAAVNTKWFHQHRTVAARLFAALDNAVGFIEARPEVARDILAKYTGVSEQVAAKMHVMPMSRSHAINRENLDIYLKVLRAMGETKVDLAAHAICIDEAATARR